MGLDLLDMTFRVEETFDVELSPDDLTELVQDRDITVGALYDLILTRLGLRDVARHDIRLNYRLWVEMQGILHSVTSVPLEGIELGTSLETLFPRETRREAWSVLREACPRGVRELDYPKAVRVVGFWLALAMVAIEQFQIWQIPGVWWLWPALGIFGMWMISETYLKFLSICSPLRNRFPSGMRTVKDLCRAVLAANYVDLCQNVEHDFDQRCPVVWEQLTQILVDTLGVDAEEITFRSRLSGDLGME